MQIKSLFSGASDDAFETQLHHLLKQYIIYTLIILCPFDMLKVKRGEIQYSLIVYFSPCIPYRFVYTFQTSCFICRYS